MAPAINHPAGVTFVDDPTHRPVNVDAAAYYGGSESYTRSRTYSHVSDTFLAFHGNALTRYLLLHSHTSMATIPNEHPHSRRTYIPVLDACPMMKRVLRQGVS